MICFLVFFSILFIFGCPESSLPHGFFLVAVSGSYSLLQCTSFLLWWLLLCSMGSRHMGSVVAAHGLSCSMACGIFLNQGSNPCPLHWQADSWSLDQGSSVTVLKSLFSPNSRDNCSTVAFESIRLGVLKLFKSFDRLPKYQILLKVLLISSYFEGVLQGATGASQKEILISVGWYVKWHGQHCPNCCLCQKESSGSSQFYHSHQANRGEDLGIFCSLVSHLNLCPKKSPMGILPPLGPQVLTPKAFSIASNSSSSRSSILQL